MKKVPNISLVRNLMLLSQLVLTLFVAKWIYSQYTEEKTILSNDLSRQFISSKQAAMDSVLLVKLIDPILKGNREFKINMEVNSAPPNYKIVTDNLTPDSRILQLSSSDSCSFSDTIMHKHDRTVMIKRGKETREDILLHGVKLIYKEVSAIGHDSTDLPETYFMSGDTLLFKKLFASNLNKSGFDFKTTWVTGEFKDTLGHPRSGFYFESDLFPKAFGVKVNDYGFYLFKKISPQILFGLFLLFITGLAFYISFRTLRDQLRLNTLKNDFISNISHELKTPVSTVKVAIEALQDFDRKHDPKVVSEYLQMASLEMNRLDLLIDKVMNTSMLENGNQIMNPVKIDLVLLINDVIKSIQPRIDYINAKVSFVPIIESATVFVDKLHLQGVLLNLIDNSLKYADKPSELIIRLEEKSNDFILSICDNGPGIPDEYLDKVFDKFFRVPTGDRHDIKGYGLGLSYASQVMHQHKGTISVSDLPEGGCNFVLSIPKPGV